MVVPPCARWHVQMPQKQHALYQRLSSRAADQAGCVLYVVARPANLKSIKDR
jgi:hypothetical protein